MVTKINMVTIVSKTTMGAKATMFTRVAIVRKVTGSDPTEDGGFLWVIKIRSAHFLRRGSKAVEPMS
jgi:hypothetical protein